MITPKVKLTAEPRWVLDGDDSVLAVEARFRELLVASEENEVMAYEVAASFYDVKDWQNHEAITFLTNAIIETLHNIRESLEAVQTEEGGPELPPPIITYPIAADRGLAWGRGRCASGLRIIRADDVTIAQWVGLRVKLGVGMVQAQRHLLQRAVNARQITPARMTKMLKSGGDAFDIDNIPKPGQKPGDYQKG